MFKISILSLALALGVFGCASTPKQENTTPTDTKPADGDPGGSGDDGATPDGGETDGTGAVGDPDDSDDQTPGDEDESPAQDPE